MGANESDWSAYEAIAIARRWSLDAIARLAAAFTDMPTGVSRHIETIAATGSLARLDASVLSDCDLIVVLRDDAELNTSQIESLMVAVYEQPAKCGFPRADTKGIYNRPSSAGQLLDAQTLGIVNEEMAAFGHRMQLLIESRPVLHSGTHRALLQAIAKRYLQPVGTIAGFDRVSCLLNDLIRYYRSYLVAKQWAFRRGDEQWFLKQVKVRHTRLLTYATAIMLLAEFSADASSDQAALVSNLVMPPMDRLRMMAEKHGETTTEIFEAFNYYLTQITVPHVRAALCASPTIASEGVEDSTPPEFEALIANGDRIAQSLFQLMLSWYSHGDIPWIQRLIF